MTGTLWGVTGTLWVTRTVLSPQERDKVMPLIIQGFRDAAEDGGTSVTGGQTVLNPWVIVGGVATAVCQSSEFIM